MKRRQVGQSRFRKLKAVRATNAFQGLCDNPVQRVLFFRQEASITPRIRLEPLEYGKPESLRFTQSFVGHMCHTSRVPGLKVISQPSAS